MLNHPPATQGPQRKICYFATGWHQNKKRGQCPRFWGGRGGGGGGSEIPENADILGFFFPRKFFSSLGLYTILTKIYKNSSISAN